VGEDERMRTIYKYPLKQLTDEQTIELPVGAEILTVQPQGEDDDVMLWLWALIDPAAETTKERTIAIHATGHHVKQEILWHINTFQLMGGAFVFHAFEVND
jgi:hypothetical protein